MTYEVGETVMYPRHGAMIVEAIEIRKIKGEDKTFLALKAVDGDLRIKIPPEMCESAGLRDVVDTKGLERVLEVLRNELSEEPTNWSRRYKANSEKIATGDVLKVAEVVRDLTRRATTGLKGLSAGEKTQLNKARGILVRELALASNSEDAAAADLLDSILAPVAALDTAA